MFSCAITPFFLGSSIVSICFLVTAIIFNAVRKRIRTETGRRAESEPSGPYGYRLDLITSLWWTDVTDAMRREEKGRATGNIRHKATQKTTLIRVVLREISNDPEYDVVRREERRLI